MKTTSFRGTCWAFGVLLAALGLVAACSIQSTPTQAAGARSTGPRTVSPTITSSAAPGANTPPTTVPAIPGGVYRTRITRDDVLSLGGDDLSNAGIWTLTVKPGTFALECRPLADPGEDCGHHLPTKTHAFLVEVGQLRGDRTTVWFVDDAALIAKLTGCNPDSDCGASDPYRLAWQATGAGLRFSIYAGPGMSTETISDWTAKPWIKIT